MNTVHFGLPTSTVEKISGVLSRHPNVEKAVIYGSRAKEIHRPGSDIDLTLHGSELGWRDQVRIMGELDDLLLPYLIDLSVFSMIDNPDLREHIERVGQVFYRRQGSAAPPEAQQAASFMGGK